MKSLSAKIYIYIYIYTNANINWFKSLENKHKLSFIQFDIDSYYPSITPELLDLALDWAARFVTISSEDRVR